MFHPIFTDLGFNVLLSEPTSEKTIALGQQYSLDEACYPVKLINGHVAELVDKKVDYIFFPDLFTVDHPGSPSRQNYGCAYMQLAFKVVNQAMDLQSRGIGLLAPTIAFSLGQQFMMNSFAKMGKQLGKTAEQTIRALQKGVKAFHDFEARMENQGKKALENLDPHKKAFVMVSKIYGVADPALNMGIADKLMEMGYPVLPFYHMPEGDLSKEHPNMFWPFAQHILEPAQLVREHPNLYAILLTHHGCGPDSVVAHFFREEMQGKPYLHIEVDEHSSGVGIITRVEAFVNSLGHLKTRIAKSPDAYMERVVHKDENILTEIRDLAPEATLYLPRLDPYARLIQTLLGSYGIQTKVLPKTDQTTVDTGRRFTISEEYFSLTALLGDVFGTCRSENGNKSLAFLIPRTEGAEVEGQYSRMVRMKLDEEGFSHVDVVSPFMEDLLNYEKPVLDAVFLCLIAGDLVRTAPLLAREEYLQRLCGLVQDHDAEHGQADSHWPGNPGQGEKCVLEKTPSRRGRAHGPVQRLHERLCFQKHGGKRAPGPVRAL